MNVEPARLVVGLLSAYSGGALSAGTLTRAGELFGFAPGTIRVALTRLKQRGTIEAVGRGQYALGDRSDSVRQDVAQWRDRAGLVTDWAGDWIAISTAGLSRTDRSENRQRERTLVRLGFAPAAPDLVIRPNNRRHSLEETRTRLTSVTRTAPVFRVVDLPDVCIERARVHWAPDKLNRNYRALTAEIEATEEAIPSLPVGEAAAATFEVGDRAIRAIVADPLLPDGWVQADRRTAFFESMLRFDEVGRRIWSQLLLEVAA